MTKVRWGKLKGHQLMSQLINSERLQQMDLIILSTSVLVMHFKQQQKKLHCKNFHFMTLAILTNQINNITNLTQQKESFNIFLLQSQENSTTIITNTINVMKIAEVRTALNN